MRNLHFMHGALEHHEPARDVAEAATNYQRIMGLHPRFHDFAGVHVDPRVGQRIAQAYEEMPSLSSHPHVITAYRHLRDETLQQFDHLVAPLRRGGAGVHVEVTDHDPYSDFHSMISDVEQGRLKVFASKSGGGHPFFTDDENDAFRAVHDAYGHAAIGRSFTRHGEEAAWLKHSQMYTPLAREAMTTETRGQTNARVFGSHGDSSQFVEQKLGVLPKALSDPKITPVGRRSKKQKALLHGT